MTKSVPTMAPTSVTLGATDITEKHWYQKDVYIIGGILFTTLLIMAGFFHFWLMRKRRRGGGKMKNTPDKRQQHWSGGYNNHHHSNNDLEFNYGLEETDSLLGRGGYGATLVSSAAAASSSSSSSLRGAGAKHVINSPFADGFDTSRSPLKVNNRQGFPSRPQPFSPVAPSIAEIPSSQTDSGGSEKDDNDNDDCATMASAAKFLNFDVGGGAIDEAGVLRNFENILKDGVMLSLHTLKGPKPVLFTMLNGEVRWQAVKMAQKRYKLKLTDIVNVEAGKLTNNFALSAKGEESCCFSLLTAKTTLDLEASCDVDCKCLVLGFRHFLKKNVENNGVVDSPEREVLHI